MFFHFQYQIRDKCCPARLVRCSQAFTGIAIKIFIEEMLIPELRIFGKEILRVIRMILVPAILITFKKADQSLGKFIRYLVKVQLFPEPVGNSYRYSGP